MSNPHEGKRLPVPDQASRPYWQACRDHRLLIQHCERCGQYQFYPRRFCTSCAGTRLEWVEASGHGAIESFTVIRHPVSKAYADEVPYVIALVRLAEGPVMMSSLVDADPDSVTSGSAVEVVFETWSDEITMPRFRLLK